MHSANPGLDEFIERQSANNAILRKNLENIQGDERDVIFISTTYGRIAHAECYNALDQSTLMAAGDV